jgi:hypothetical protein
MSLTKMVLPDVPLACLFEQMAEILDVPVLVPDTDHPQVIVVEKDHENFKTLINDYNTQGRALVESIKARITHLTDQYQKELDDRKQGKRTEKKTDS